jgi:hypothetical protein
MLTRSESESEISHPFCYGPKGFEYVLGDFEVESEGLLEDIRQHLRDGRAS